MRPNLPKGWRVFLLGDIARISSGGTPNRQRAEYWGGHIPWITTAKINYKEITEAEEYITEAGLNNSSTKMVPKGTLLMAMYGQGATRGRVGILGISAAANQACAIIEPIEAVTRQYLYCYLSHNYESIRRLGHGGNQANLSGELIKSIRIPIPPAQEQEAITKIMSSWDTAIEKTSDLIAAKQKLKKALMQQLIMGKLRFKEFKGQKWKVAHLEDCADVLFSGVDKLTNDGEVPVRLCNYTDVYYNDTITNDMDFMEATATQTEISKFSLKKGDVMITKDSEVPEDIAVAAYVAEDLENTLCGYHLALIRPNREVLLGEFLSYLFGSHAFMNYFYRHANGVTRFGLTTNAVFKAPIPLPSVPEQVKIAGVFGALSTEIGLLNERVEMLQQQKKGLMQKLLTGKVRVKV